jgi:SAM-dependent methyltransferase
VADPAAASYRRAVPDRQFEDRRLARIYDRLDPDRRDLDAYASIVDELGARRVLDVGCGTGTFPCLLALRGVDVVGVDPAGASLDVARGKSGADRVRWILGDATSLPPLEVDLCTMTGNVAQVFLTDEDWAATLAGISAALRPGGALVFESRVPSRRAWEAWTPELTRARTEIPGEGPVETWCTLVEVAEPLVSFRWTYVFESDGVVLTSDSTLRFRDRDEIEGSLRAAGCVVDDVREAPDRPGREHVFIARAPARR